MALHRGRRVAQQVRERLLECTQHCGGQSGFLQWECLSGKVWGVFEEGRCLWLLIHDPRQETTFYYRHRGDVEHFELHAPGQDGGTVRQKVESIGLVLHAYRCDTGSDFAAIEKKIAWWNLQRWVRGVRRYLPSRKAA
jgi:hypothetical protein